MLQSRFLFVLASLCKISGGYLVWLALREGYSPWLIAILAVSVIDRNLFDSIFFNFQNLFIPLEIPLQIPSRYRT